MKAHIVTPQEERFVATWVPSEACEPYQDEEGRLLHRPLAEHVVKRIEGQPAIVTGYNGAGPRQRRHAERHELAVGAQTVDRPLHRLRVEIVNQTALHLLTLLRRQL